MAATRRTGRYPKAANHAIPPALRAYLGQLEMALAENDTERDRAIGALTKEIAALRQSNDVLRRRASLLETNGGKSASNGGTNEPPDPEPNPGGGTPPGPVTNSPKS